MSDSACPAGTVLIKSGQGPHRDEPAFCVDVTETTQAADAAFWAARQQSGYKNDKPQPEGDFAGPKKPAIYRSWSDARTYCQGTYPGGDLPTERQWEQACGDKKYCTASGTLNPREAIYDVKHPADVATTLMNPQGVYDLTGNVWEWMRDDYDAKDPGCQDPKCKALRGGSWIFIDQEVLQAAFLNYFPPTFRGRDIGYRCVARPQDPKK